MNLVHDTTAGKILSCVGVLGVSWGNFLANTQSVLAIVAALAATVYSIYMTYDLYDRRRKSDKR